MGDKRINKTLENLKFLLVEDINEDIPLRSLMCIKERG